MNRTFCGVGGGSAFGPRQILFLRALARGYKARRHRSHVGEGAQGWVEGTGGGVGGGKTLTTFFFCKQTLDGIHDKWFVSIK